MVSRAWLVACWLALVAIALFVFAVILSWMPRLFPVAEAQTKRPPTIACWQYIGANPCDCPQQGVEASVWDSTVVYVPAYDLALVPTATDFLYDVWERRATGGRVVVHSADLTRADFTLVPGASACYVASVPAVPVRVPFQQDATVRAKVGDTFVLLRSAYRLGAP